MPYLKGPNYLDRVNNKTNNHKIMVDGESMTIAQACSAAQHALQKALETNCNSGLAS